MPNITEFLQDAVGNVTIELDTGVTYSFKLGDAVTYDPVLGFVANGIAVGGGGGELTGPQLTALTALINGTASAIDATARGSAALALSRSNHTGTQDISTVTGLQTALDAKQATLTSGTNIRTVNGQSVLGSGDLTIAGGGVTDHGALTGLGDDDHPQYLTNARGDARYTPVAHAGSGGGAHSNVVSGGAAGFMSGADKAKLDGVAPSATANASDASLRDRSTHTGSQAISTVTGLQGALDQLDADKIDATAFTPLGPDLTASLDTDLVVVTRGGVPYTVPLGVLVARRAIARDLPVLKTARALSVFQSTNTAADTAATYINHIDVTPAEFDFPVEGWDMDVEIAMEGGLQGVTINDSVAVGTLAKTIRIYVGIPGGSLTTFANVSQTNDFVQPAATRATTAMFKFYATPFSLGQVIEAHSIGAVGWPGSGSGPFNKQASRDFRANGLRVLVSGLYGAQGAGHIIKITRLSVLLKK